MRRSSLIVAALALSGCLSDPELSECHDFAFGTPGCEASPCEIYCGLMAESCGEIYDSEALCINDCANEPVTDFVAGEFGDTEGNSLSCRVTYARQGDCAEAALVGTTQCLGVTCDDYCELMVNGPCADAYPSLANCLDACDALPRGESSDVNSVECRFGYAQMAQEDDQLCDAASLSGGGVCGDPCDVYCDFLDISCTGEFALYPDRATCQATCSLMSVGAFDDWQFTKEEDSIDCRVYHAGPPAILDPATHCPHARVYNDQHCAIEPGLSPQPVDWPCVAYCNIALSACPGLYAGLADCRTDCATFPEVLAPDPALGPQIFPVTSTICPTR